MVIYINIYLISIDKYPTVIYGYNIDISLVSIVVNHTYIYVYILYIYIYIYLFIYFICLLSDLYNSHDPCLS